MNMEDEVEKQIFKSYYKNNAERKFLLSNYFEEFINKNKKNSLPKQIQKYITTINKGIDTLQKEDFVDGFYNRFYYENYSKNRNQNNEVQKKEMGEFPKINSQDKKSKTKTKDKYNIKNQTNYIINNNISKNNFLNKTFNINQIKEKTNNEINELLKEKRNSKFIVSRQSFLHPLDKISNTDDKNFYIKNHNMNNSIYNITEESKVIEKKLYKKEKKKYFSGFKIRYRSLMKKSKNNIIDINEFINGKGGNKNNLKKNLLNKYKIIKIQNVLNQINRKIKKINHKEKMTDIIKDVKQFKEKEKIIKNKFEKTDEKFNNLIFDSNFIAKKILKKFNTNRTDF